MCFSASLKCVHNREGRRGFYRGRIGHFGEKSDDETTKIEFLASFPRKTEEDMGEPLSNENSMVSAYIRRS